jgi:PAS domain S-box-containing protein
MFGYEPGELAGKPIEELVPDRLREQHADHRSAYARRPYTRAVGAGHELAARRKDGTEFLAEIYLAPVSTPDGQFVVSVCRDASGGRRVEELLQRQRAATEFVLQGLPVVLWTTGRELRLTSCLGSGLAGVGIRPDEAVGATVSELFGTDGLEAPSAAHLRALEGHGASYRGRWLERFYEARVQPLRERDGEVVGCIGIAFDTTERVHAEQALRASEERYRSLFENANDIVYAHDLEGRFTAVNRRGEEITGYSRAEIVGEDITKIVAPEHVARARRNIERKLAGEAEATTYELDIVTRSGQRIPLEVSTRLVRENGTPVAVEGIARDISERRRAEEDLRRTQESLTKAQEIAHLGSWDWDIVANELRWSDEIFRIFGLQPQGFGATYEAFLERVHPEDRDPVQRAVEASLAGERPYSIEHRVVRPDGSERIVHEQAEVSFDGEGRPVRMLGTVLDITERKRAELALVETSQTLEAIVHASPAAIVAIDVEGDVVLWNPAAAELFGWSADEVIGRPLPVIPEDRLQEFREHRERCLRGATVTGLETRHRRKDGSSVDVILSAAPLRRAEGAIAGLVALVMDVTRARQLEEQLRQSQKMEVVGQLAGGLAHDFNNLLTVIQSYAQLLLERARNGDPMRASLVEIDAAARSAATLTRQLLAFASRQFLHPQVVDLNVVVQDVEGMLRRVIPESIRLVTDLEPRLGAVSADPGQMEQVLLNLCLNARDAMPEGGELLVATRNVDARDEALSLERGQPGPEVLLLVADTGCGMDEETKGRIFEPFFTTKPVGKGAGLGLAVVYGIVKQSGGEIAVTSSPGGGTTFAIRLARVEEGPLPPTSPETWSGDVSLTGSETILLVEDHAGVREVCRHTLSDRGYTVLEARDGNEALAILGDRAVRVDIVVSDLVMPQMGGRELTRRAVELRPEIAVLLLSGYEEEAVGSPGAFELSVPRLLKPFTPEALARNVREALDTPRSRGRPSP